MSRAGRGAPGPPPQAEAGRTSPGPCWLKNEDVKASSCQHGHPTLTGTCRESLCRREALQAPPQSQALRGEEEMRQRDEKPRVAAGLNSQERGLWS